MANHDRSAMQHQIGADLFHDLAAVGGAAAARIGSSPVSAAILVNAGKGVVGIHGGCGVAGAFGEGALLALPALLVAALIGRAKRRG